MSTHAIEPVMLVYHIGHEVHDCDPATLLNIIAGHCAQDHPVKLLYDHGAQATHDGTLPDITSSAPASHVGATIFTVLTTCNAELPCVSV